MRPARPTLRCLREDLELPLPPVTVPLDEIEHPILAKAAEQFADAETKHERIRAVDDQVLFKVKVQRWRGAVRSGWVRICPGWWRPDGARTARATTFMPCWRRTPRRPGPATTPSTPTG